MDNIRLGHKSPLAWRCARLPSPVEFWGEKREIKEEVFWCVSNFWNRRWRPYISLFFLVATDSIIWVLIIDISVFTINDTFDGTFVFALILSLNKRPPYTYMYGNAIHSCKYTSIYRVYRIEIPHTTYDQITGGLIIWMLYGAIYFRYSI